MHAPRKALSGVFVFPPAQDLWEPVLGQTLGPDSALSIACAKMLYLGSDPQDGCSRQRGGVRGGKCLLFLWAQLDAARSLCHHFLQSPGTRISPQITPDSTNAATAALSGLAALSFRCPAIKQVERSDGARSDGMFWAYVEDRVEISTQGMAGCEVRGSRRKGRVQGTSAAALPRGRAVI